MSQGSKEGRKSMGGGIGRKENRGRERERMKEEKERKGQERKRERQCKLYGDSWRRSR